MPVATPARHAPTVPVLTTPPPAHPTVTLLFLAALFIVPLYFVKHYLDLAIAYLTRPPLDTSHGPAPPIAPPPPAPPNQAALALERVYAFAEVDPLTYFSLNLLFFLAVALFILFLDDISEVGTP